MLDTLAVMDQKDIGALIVNLGSGMCRLASTGYDAFCFMFPSDVARPKLLDTMASMDQKDSCSCCCLYKAGTHRVNTPRAVFSSLVRRPMMLVIMAAMDQYDCCSGMCKAGIAGDSAFRAVFSSLVRRPMMLGIVAGMDQKSLFLRRHPFRAA